MPKRASTRRRFTTAAPTRRGSNPRRHYFRRFFLGFLLVCFLGLTAAAVWYGSRLEVFTITNVKVEGGETVSHDRVKEIAGARLSGEYFSFIPRRFSLSYPAEEILAEVRSLPRVKDAQVRLADRHTILISISEYYPFALWCRSINDDGSPCFFLDADGYSFIEAPVLNGGSMLRYFGQRSEPRVAEQPFDTAFMTATSRVALSLARDFDFAVTHVERTAPDEVIYHLAGDSFIKASLRQSVEATLSNLATVLRSEEFAHLRPGNFQYIDLRFGSKVFINEEVPGAATSSDPLL